MISDQTDPPKDSVERRHPGLTTIDMILETRRDLRPMHHLAFLAEYWREWGHTVRVVQALSSDVPAQIGIIHVDLTVISDEILEWARRYRSLVNGQLRDISKRTVSRHLLAREDNFVGPVIIKTNLNRGGKPEMRRSSAWPIRNPIGIFRRELARTGRWRLAKTLPPNDYPVLPSMDEVPDWVWQNDGLVVEKFLPERFEGLYASRIWVFLGDREYGRLELSNSPTGRGREVVKRSYVPEIPAEVRAVRKNLGMDFGKIDWAYTSEGPVVFDANRTPSRVTIPTGQDRDVMVQLAKGIRVFLL